MMKEQSKNKTDLAATGIAGLDSVLNGGLPRNRVYLIEGTPGAGKTTLGMQFLMEGVKRKEKVLYIALSESKEEVEEVAASHGWSLAGIDIIEVTSLEQQMRTRESGSLFHPSEVELQNVIRALLDSIDQSKPQRIVFDSLSELRIMSDGGLRYRRQLLKLKQFFMGRGCTVLLLEEPGEKSDTQAQSIAHGVIVLERQALVYSTERRRLRVDKVRGLRFQEGNHDFIIEMGGIQVFPRLIAHEARNTTERQDLTSGVPELDALLGGGLTVGTSNLFIGPAGTAKTTLCLLFAHSAARQGRKAMIFSFDENLRTLRTRAAGIGLDLESVEKSGMLVFQRVDPAELTPGQFAHRIKDAVEKNSVEVVLIDSMNGYLAAMPDQNFLTLHLHELLTFLGQSGVTTLFTLAQAGMIGQMQSPADITYLADTVVLLRFFEAQGAVKKAISVVKKRTSRHEETIRELSLDSQGVRVGRALTDFHGVLTGVPKYLGGDDDLIKNRTK